LLHEDIADIGQLLSAGGYYTAHAGKWHVEGRDVRDGFDCLYFGKAKILAGGGEYYDGPTSRAVLDVLTSNRMHEPFFLQVGLINPHDICEFEHLQEINNVPDPVEQGILKESDLPPLPESFGYDESETIVQHVFRRDEDALIHRPILEQSTNWTRLQWRYLAWMHYRYVERVDVEIGRILSALDARGAEDNTILIFASDHGEAAGKHRMFQKFTLYEESVRTPLTIAQMGDKNFISSPGRTVDALNSGVDLFATICDYAGVEAPRTTQGRSLRPIVEGTTDNHRSNVFIENNYWERAIVTDRYKFITEYVPNPGDEAMPPSVDTHDWGMTQLFDLIEDPSETRNVAHDPEMEDVVAECRNALIAEESGLTRRKLRSGGPREYARHCAEALRRGWKKTGAPVPRR
jgi:glucosamine-6-phosphate deaminase